MFNIAHPLHKKQEFVHENGLADVFFIVTCEVESYDKAISRGDRKELSRERKKIKFERSELS